MSLPSQYLPQDQYDAFAAMTAPPSPKQGAQIAQNNTSALSPYLNYGIPQMPAITQPQISQDALNYPTFLKNLGEQSSQEAFQRALNTGAASPQTLMHAQDQLNSNRLNYMGQAGQAQLGVDKVKNDFLDSWNQLLTQIYGVQAGMRGQDLAFINGRLTSTGGVGGRGGITSYGGTPNAIGGGARSPTYYPELPTYGSGSPDIQRGEASGSLDPGISYGPTGADFVSQGFTSGWN